MLSKVLFNAGRAALGKRTCLALRVAQARLNSNAPAVVAGGLPAELNLNQYPAQLHDWENFKMPGAPYEGMGPLPPLPDYDPAATRHYVIPEEWFEFLYPRTGATGLYTLFATTATMLISKEYYVYSPETWYTGWFILGVLVVNKLAGPYLRQTFEDLRVDGLIALDQVKEEEVTHLTEILDNVKLERWRAGAQELYNEAKLANVAMMLETAFIERQATVVNSIKQKLDYQIAVQKVESELAQNQMVNWVQEKVMETITPESQKETLTACIAELNAIAAAK